MSQELTIDDAKKAMGVHVLEKGYMLREKYGTFIDYGILLKIMTDDNFVRFPTRIEFCSAKIEKGFFALAEKISKDSSDGYVIYVHDHFKKRLGDVPALVLYHLVTVNYGDFASSNDAELFASAALGMKQDEYYEHICHLADQIPYK